VRRTIVIDPVTRIEGHLKVEIALDNGIVVDAKSSGTLFRGIELILRGRDPRDAQRITQRICGVCPSSHATAAALALDNAFGISDMIPENAKTIRNLILGADYISDHILHFYHLSALDYVDFLSVAKYNGKNVVLRSLKRFAQRGELAPFKPRYEGDYRLPEKENLKLVEHYVKALEMRRKAHQLFAIFGGKAPHNVGIVPGGVTQTPTIDKITSFLWRLNELRDFIDNTYIPDVILIAENYPDYFEIGSGCRSWLSYGVFDLGNGDYTTRERLFKQGVVSEDLTLQPLDLEKIEEEVKYSWYHDNHEKHPSKSDTKPERKREAYSWIKAPRYDGKPKEVGPLARILVNYTKKDSTTKEVVDAALGQLAKPLAAMYSVLGRHLARALETKIVADSMVDWVLNLKPGEPIYREYEIPEKAEGYGLTDAVRGALGHWIKIEKKKIANYQCVVPTTWNASPKDEKNQHGPIEQALIGTEVEDEENPFEIVRIVRSFDPCLACAVHMVTLDGKKLGEHLVP